MNATMHDYPMVLWNFSTESRRIIRETHEGSSNFNYTKNRILWSTRNRPVLRNTPKSPNEVHSYSGKQRSKYKVKTKK